MLGIPENFGKIEQFRIECIRHSKYFYSLCNAIRVSCNLFNEAMLLSTGKKPWLKTVFIYYQKCLIWIFAPKKPISIMARNSLKKFADGKMRLFEQFYHYCDFFWGFLVIVGNKKMVVVTADLAWLNGPNRTRGYVWWNLLKTLPRLSCKKRHLTRCFENAALP